MGNNRMKLVAISDTHGQFPKNFDNLPKADILIHAGDWSSAGTYQETAAFLLSLDRLGPKFDKILCVPGNHDIWISQNEAQAKELFKEVGADLLIDESLEYKGINFHGNPWCPQFGSWAYMKDADFRLRKASFIPYNTNILITHSPAHGILDTLDEISSEPGKHAGCIGIKQALDQISPDILISGHIHEGYGVKKYNETLCFNVANLNSRYKHQANYTVIEL